MRQVPQQQYLVVGNGRLARHIKHYLSLLNISILSWSRAESFDLLIEKSTRATHILLCISDNAIDPLVSRYLDQTSAVRVHFSGSLYTSKAYGAHPLMTFSDVLYTLEQYQSIPFVLDEFAPDFTSILPGLSNTHVRLSPDLKARYHALCVLAGNFSCLLWQKCFSDFEHFFHFPPSIAHPFLKQQMQNLIDDPRSALTGPLVRHDELTLEKNRNALKNDPFQAVYDSFVTCFKKMKREKKI